MEVVPEVQSLNLNPSSDYRAPASCFLLLASTLPGARQAPWGSLQTPTAALVISIMMVTFTDEAFRSRWDASNSKSLLLHCKVVIFFSDLSQSERRIQSIESFYIFERNGRYTWRSCGKSKKIEVFATWRRGDYIMDGGETIYPYARPYIHPTHIP
jgi:hypothetical protein